MKAVRFFQMSETTHLTENANTLLLCESHLSVFLLIVIYFLANIRMYPVRPSFNSSQNMDLSLVPPTPEVARSKALVCGRSLAGSVGSNPFGGMDVNVVCCQVEVSATG